jgi:hypothetical protein
MDVDVEELAIHVLAQAVRDARQPGRRCAERAQQWLLTDSAALQWWTWRAGIRVEWSDG